MAVTPFLRSVISAFARLIGRPAWAHCDSEDGPAAVDARRALQVGNVNIALKWVRTVDEAEVRAAFDKALRVRSTGGEAAQVAERWFVETLVRVHRAGEGAGFTGLQPAGTPVAPQVAAADRALADGTIEPLRGLVEPQRWPELEHRFQHALALKGFDDDDLVAARAYMDAYVSFFKYAEGEQHDHGHHGHDDGHADGAERH